jgi:hypothetical protein
MFEKEMFHKGINDRADITVIEMPWGANVTVAVLQRGHA